jgi:mannose-6-phosphate isomerase
MSQPAPIPLAGAERTLPEGGDRIRKILGRDTASERVGAIVDLDASTDTPAYTAAYVDATSAFPLQAGMGTTAIHVLWTTRSGAHTIRAGIDLDEEGGLRPFEVHPGDTITVPPGVPVAIGAGIVGFVFAGGPIRPAQGIDDWRSDIEVHPPSHGLQLFHRYNRRTICAAAPDLLLERWKITEPLTLSLDLRRWHYLTNLVDPIALTWRGGSDLLGRTRSRLLPAGMTSITLVPDGIGYVLLGYIPDLEHDVIGPLQRAGYDRATISTLGVVPENQS